MDGFADNALPPLRQKVRFNNKMWLLDIKPIVGGNDLKI